MVLDFNILTWLISFITLGVILSKLRQNQSWPYLLCFSVFWVYLMFALRETIFPIPLTEDAVAPIPLEYNLNLIPFYFGPYSGFRQSALTSFLNVLLTMPFGFGISFVAKVKARDFLWLTWLPGLFFETSQLMMHLGFGGGWRLIDINDVIFNAAGTLLGYGLFKLFIWIYLAATQRFDSKLQGLFGYVYEIAKGV